MSKGFSDRLFSLLVDVKCSGFDFHVGDASTPRPYLQVRFWAPCASGGHLEQQNCRKWFLSEHMTDGELVQTAFKAVLAAVEHEVRENFRYKSQPIFGPHFDIEKLVELCASGNAIKGRA